MTVVPAGSSWPVTTVGRLGLENRDGRSDEVGTPEESQLGQAAGEGGAVAMIVSETVDKGISRGEER